MPCPAFPNPLHTAAQERNSRGLVALPPCLLFPVELCLLFSGHLHKRNLIRLAACKRHGVTDQFTAASLLRTAAQERNSRGLVALLPCFAVADRSFWNPARVEGFPALALPTARARQPNCPRPACALSPLPCSRSRPGGWTGRSSSPAQKKSCFAIVGPQITGGGTNSKANVMRISPSSCA